MIAFTFSLFLLLHDNQNLQVVASVSMATKTYFHNTCLFRVLKVINRNKTDVAGQ